MAEHGGMIAGGSIIVWALPMVWIVDELFVLFCIIMLL